MIKSIFNDKLQGIVRVDRVAENGSVIDSVKHNLVVNNARNIIAQLLYSPVANLALSVLQLGTLGLTYGDDTSDLPSPSPSDIALVAPYYSVSATTITQLTMYNRPAIQLFWSIPSTQANDPNPAVMNKLIAELGLFNGANQMFARIILPIVKTTTIGLNIYWTVII